MTVAFSVAALPIYAVAVAPALGGASAAGILVAAYGTGNLLGSAGLMLRPLRSDADRLRSVLAALVAATLTAVIVAPTLATSLVGFRALRRLLCSAVNHGPGTSWAVSLGRAVHGQLARESALFCRTEKGLCGSVQYFTAECSWGRHPGPWL